MKCTVRFSKTCYASDISSLRSLIKTSGRTGNVEIKLVFYITDGEMRYLDIMIFLKDLYVISFMNSAGQWVYFNGKGGGCISENGSYGSLNIQLDIFKITLDKLKSAYHLKEKLRAGVVLTQTDKDQLACVIVGVSEALRFQEVFFNIQNIVSGKLVEYIPPSRLLNYWGQLSSVEADIGRVVAIKTV